MRPTVHRQHMTHRSRPRAAVALGASLALVLGVHGGLAAQPEPDIDTACRDDAQRGEHFGDVDRSDTHAGAIDCLWVYGIVQGVGGGDGFTFNPGDEVTREQMASFTANMLRALPDRVHQLPDADQPVFEDADLISSAHRSNVATLVEAGVVTGYDDDTFRPARSIDRAQMATFIARALETVLDGELPRDAGGFGDVDGVHAVNIEKLTAIGVVQGIDADRYGPTQVTTRAQMASFVARALDHLAVEDVFVPGSFGVSEDGARQVLTEVEIGAHDGFDRTSITTGGDDREPGWQVRYVDDPVAHGSGAPVDVEGDAVLRVVVTGTAPPTELDDPDDAFDGETLRLEGESIVEIVDVGWFEGQHLLFVGTTGLHAFDVERLPDRFGIYLDVSHGS